MVKLLGAVCIIAGCGGVGFSMCCNYRKQEQAMQQLLRGLEWMILELNYRMPPLAALCRGAAAEINGTVGQVFLQFADELDHQLTPDVSTCMAAAISATARVPEAVKGHLWALGTSLGRFDLQGQICGLEAAAALCKRDLQLMSSGRDVRLRNYQTLGLCAGAALVILFI